MDAQIDKKKIRCFIRHIRKKHPGFFLKQYQQYGLNIAPINGRRQNDWHHYQEEDVLNQQHNRGGNVGDMQDNTNIRHLLLSSMVFLGTLMVLVSYYMCRSYLKILVLTLD